MERRPPGSPQPPDAQAAAPTLPRPAGVLTSATTPQPIDRRIVSVGQLLGHARLVAVSMVLTGGSALVPVRPTGV